LGQARFLSTFAPGNARKDDAVNRSRWARWPAFIVVALIGLAVRLPQLNRRPMHTDEAVNAYMVGQLLAGEAFTYDPQDRHGPALVALALPLARLQGARTFAELTESELRLTSVAAGTFTILMFGAATEMFGVGPSLLAALLFAVAPLPVYYDRYFIHESLFCAATFGLILSGWRACKSCSVRQAALAGACAALMFASKETAILHLLALAAAALVFRVRNLREKGPIWSFSPRFLLAPVATFLALLLILLTWFGRNWNALPALLHVGPDVLARAAGQGHQEPLWYYGQLLTVGWSGGLLFALAFLGFIISISKRDASPYGLLSYYGFFIAAIYSLIPYKTPWLTLNLWLPLSLLVATALTSLWRWIAKKLHQRAVIPAFCILVILLGAVIAHDTCERVFLHPADETNPYAYAHTADDILGLSAEISDLARRDGLAVPRIAVIASDPWPLPWYLRHFDRVGFWQPGQHVPDADFFITSTEAAERYADRLRNLRSEFFGVRPGVLILLWSPPPK
jgi:uncharacterized protein (TIGR03663 family)